MAGHAPVRRAPARARIRKKAEFARARREGRRVRTDSFVIVLSARDAEQATEPPRLGIVAPRKVGNAVARNRAKRLIREAFRASSDLFDPGLDIVVIVTRSVENQKVADVLAEWRAEAPRIRRRAADALASRARAPAGPADA